MSTENERTLEERLDELESRTSISELVAGYCETVDRRDEGRFMRLWHDDAAYLIPGGRGDFIGTEQIRHSLEVIAKAWKETYHWTTNHVVRFEGHDVAHGRSDVYAMCTHHGGQFSFVGGTYEDTYERRDGAWRYARRYVDRHFVSAPVAVELLPPF